MLSSEWQYIENLVNLQQLRYEYPLALEIEVKGDLDSKSIPPYMFIPFVENAFKHGDLSASQEPLKIYLSVTAKTIDLFIENRIAHVAKDREGGIGLENVKRRLQLLYPGKHILELSSSKNKFSIHLQIKD